MVTQVPDDDFSKKNLRFWNGDKNGAFCISLEIIHLLVSLFSSDQKDTSEKIMIE